MDNLLSIEEAIYALQICDLNEEQKNCHKCPLRDKRWNGAWVNDETDCCHELMQISAKLLSMQNNSPQ